MSGDTTTIEITDAQKDALEARKVHEREPIRDVVGRLLDGSDQGGENLSPESYRDAVSSLGDEDLERIKSQLDTIEERTGSIESVLEGLR